MNAAQEGQVMAPSVVVPQALHHSVKDDNLTILVSQCCSVLYCVEGEAFDVFFFITWLNFALINDVTVT